MDFSAIAIDAATASFWNDVRAWLDDHVTDAMIEAEWDSGWGHDPDFHRALCEKGWAFSHLAMNDEDTLGDIQRQILELELTRAHAPSNTRELTAIVLPAVQRWMNGPVRDDILAKAARGDACFCLGYTEPEAGSDLAAVRTRASRDGDHWLINGQKMFTTGAQNCDFSFLIARTQSGESKHAGLTMFLVPLNADGVDIAEVRTLGGERTNMVFYDNVRVHDDYRLGNEGDGWAVIHGPLNAEHRMSEDGPRPVDEEAGEAGMGGPVDLSAHILRVHEPAVRSAVEWAFTFDHAGRRPIDDRIVRRRLAEIELGLLVSKLTPGPHGRVVAAEMIIRNTAELVDLLGPEALLPRSEPTSAACGWIEYAHRFAQGTSIYGGTTEIFLNLLAERFLGLPRRRTKP